MAVARCAIVVFAGTLFGCGRVDYEPLNAPGNDARQTVQVEVDGNQTSPGSCDWRDGPRFSPPTRLLPTQEVGVEDADPVFSPDALTVFFVRASGGQTAILQASRPSRDAPFLPPTPMMLVAGSNGDARFGISDDGLTAYLSSSRSGGIGGVDIWLSTRLSDSEPFPALSPAQGVNTTADEHNAEMFGDADELWFSGDPTRSGQHNIYAARRMEDSFAFAAPSLVTELSSPSFDTNPSLTADGLVVIFASSRSGSLKLWYALRDSRAESFANVSLVPDIERLGTTQGHPDVSGDGCELVFVSTSSSGSSALYRAEFVQL